MWYLGKAVDFNGGRYKCCIIPASSTSDAGERIASACRDIGFSADEYIITKIGSHSPVYWLSDEDYLKARRDIVNDNIEK